jgi:hypothetical protein
VAAHDNGKRQRDISIFHIFCIVAKPNMRMYILVVYSAAAAAQIISHQQTTNFIVLYAAGQNYINIARSRKSHEKREAASLLSSLKASWGSKKPASQPAASQ